MELKKELLEFLEANNLFGLEDRENAEGVVDSYLKVYKKQLTLTDVSQRSKLLFAFEEYWNTNNCDGENFGNVVDRFLANNCG